MSIAAAIRFGGLWHTYGPTVSVGTFGLQPFQASTARRISALQLVRNRRVEELGLDDRHPGAVDEEGRRARHLDRRAKGDVGFHQLEGLGVLRVEVRDPPMLRAPCRTRSGVICGWLANSHSSMASARPLARARRTATAASHAAP